jgi:methyl-accepting chemotaxis protein
MKLATKFTAAIISVLLLVSGTMAAVGYRTAYNQVKESVGIELVGCANITTGLVDPGDVEKLAGKDLTDLAKLEQQLSWTVDHKAIFKEAYLLSLDGTILAADKRMKENGFKAGDTYYLSDEDRSHILQTKHSLYSDVYEFGGEALMTGYGPIYKDHDPNKEVIALMAINFDAGIIQERTLDTIFLPFVSGAVIMLIGAFLIYIIIRRMVKPIARLSETVNHIAKGDLTVEPLQYDSKDEVGALSKDIRVMTSSLRTLIQEVNLTSAQVASSSEELTASAEQTGKSSEQVALVAQELAIGAESQVHSLEQISEVIHRISSDVEQIFADVQDVSAAALDTVTKADFGLQSSGEVVGQMSTINGTISELSRTVNELSFQSKEIGKIVEVITDIAAQTNLLALNAAIEAARAGEQGRGFTVVAGSIRKLAEQSSRSAGEIAQLVESILGQMNKMTEQTASASREVEEGTEKVRSAGETFVSIRSSAKDTAGQVEHVFEAVTRLSQGADKVVDSIKDLLALANSTAEGTQNTSAATEEQLATMQEISASAAYLSSMADELQAMVERFKVNM